MPLGAALGGLVARSFGLPATFVVAGAASGLGLLAALRWLPRSVVEQAEATAPPPLGRLTGARDGRSASGRSSRRPTVRRESDARAFTGT